MIGHPAFLRNINLQQTVFLDSMHGLGDNIAQRGLVRHLLAKGHEVYINTPWPDVYYDCPGLKFVKTISSLRAQKRNIQKQSDRMTYDRPTSGTPVKIHYTWDLVQRYGSIPQAIAARAGVLDPVSTAFEDRTPFLQAPCAVAVNFYVYHPLTSRKEWPAIAARNPDYKGYAELAQKIQNILRDCKPVSISDEEPGQEEIVKETMLKGALEYHKGELDFFSIGAHFLRSAFVMTSPGFFVHLCIALGVPVIVVFGGYENRSTFPNPGKHCYIEPMEPGSMFSQRPTNKRIDMAQASAQLSEFFRSL